MKSRDKEKWLYSYFYGVLDIGRAFGSDPPSTVWKKHGSEIRRARNSKVPKLEPEKAETVPKMANSEKKSDRSMWGCHRSTRGKHLEEWPEVFEVELSEMTRACGRSRAGTGYVKGI